MEHIQDIQELQASLISLFSALDDEAAGENVTSPAAISLDHVRSGANLERLCRPEQLPAAAGILDDQGFMLESITGVDRLEQQEFELWYDFIHTGIPGYRVVLRCTLPREEAERPSLCALYPAANWHEREVFDFFGIHFNNHPDLTRILLPEDADFYPLRKDYTP